MKPIDEAIATVERLYESVTGQPAPATSEQAYAPIPAERAPGEYVEEQAARLFRVLSEQPLERSTDVAAATIPPVCTAQETDDALLFLVELPGVRREDVHVATDKGIVTVTAQRRGPEPTASVTTHFRAQLPAPPHVAAEDVRARMRDGLLELSFPKVQPGTERRQVVVD